MRNILLAAVAAFLLASGVALADEDACRSPREIELGVKALYPHAVMDYFSGDAAARFMGEFATVFDTTVKYADEVVAFTSDEGPESTEALIVGFEKGCKVGSVSVDMDLYRSLVAAAIMPDLGG